MWCAKKPSETYILSSLILAAPTPTKTMCQKLILADAAFPKTLLKELPHLIDFAAPAPCVRWFPKGLETVEKVQRCLVSRSFLPGRALVAGCAKESYQAF